MAKKNKNIDLDNELNDNIVIKNSVIEKTTLSKIVKKETSSIKPTVKLLKLSDYIDFAFNDKMTKNILKMKYKQYENSVKTIGEWNELIKL